MRKLTYIYPIRQNVSFRRVARYHIRELRRHGVEVVEKDIKMFTEDDIGEVTVLHPIFYPLTGSPKRLRWLVKKASTLIGFDVCDTNRISRLAAYISNMFDMVILPSTFCKHVYRYSGVYTRLEVLPHGIDSIFLRPPRDPKDPDVKKVAEKKGTKILFFLWHSGFRKGSDVVAEAFSRIVKEFKDVYLIVKLCGILDPFIEFMMYIPNVVLFNKWLSDDDLVDLYDVCDIVVVPSRGGGFELNALEGLARGKIVITSQWGAFQDYCKECLQVGTRRLVDLFMGDPNAKLIHDGKGVDPDPDDLYQKLKYAITMKDTLSKKYERIAEYVRRNYTWERIGERLVALLKPFLT